jgi:hypothetical protein
VSPRISRALKDAIDYSLGHGHSLGYCRLKQGLKSKELFTPFGSSYSYYLYMDVIGLDSARLGEGQIRFDGPASRSGHFLRLTTAPSDRVTWESFSPKFQLACDIPDLSDESDRVNLRITRFSR